MQDIKVNTEEDKISAINQNIINILYSLLERLVYNPIIELLNNKFSLFQKNLTEKPHQSQEEQQFVNGNGTENSQNVTDLFNQNVLHEYFISESTSGTYDKCQIAKPILPATARQSGRKITAPKRFGYD